MPQPIEPSHRLFIERLVITIATVALALLAWRLKDLLLLLFGSALVAVILGIIARPLSQRLKLRHGIALLIAVLALLGLLALAIGLFGAQLAGQADQLRKVLPEAWATLQQRLEPYGLAAPLREFTDETGIASRIGSVAAAAGAGLADALLVIVGGIYLAAEPRLYRTGLLKLVPERHRPLAAHAVQDSVRGLTLWLKGRLVSMSAVGVLTVIGLSLLQVPGALALALVAALLEFIPYFGPILSAVPAILLAIAIDPVLALWTAGLYFLIQQIEGNVLEPIVQEHAVSIPPVLLLFAVVAGTMLFGIPGVVLSAPLAVVLYIMVKRLYVREALHTRTPIPGEDG